MIRQREKASRDTEAAAGKIHPGTWVTKFTSRLRGGRKKWLDVCAKKNAGLPRKEARRETSRLVGNSGNSDSVFAYVNLGGLGCLFFLGRSGRRSRGSRGSRSGRGFYGSATAGRFDRSATARRSNRSFAASRSSTAAGRLSAAATVLQAAEQATVATTAIVAVAAIVVTREQTTAATAAIIGHLTAAIVATATVVQTREQTTTATATTAVATETGNSRALLTADEGDTDHREKHRDAKH